MVKPNWESHVNQNIEMTDEKKMRWQATHPQYLGMIISKKNARLDHYKRVNGSAKNQSHGGSAPYERLPGPKRGPNKQLQKIA